MSESIKTEDIIWKLTDLYQNTDDLKIEEDLKNLRLMADEFSKKYRGNIAGIDPESLYEAICTLEDIGKLLGKIESFAFLNYSTQSQDAKAGAFLQKVYEVESEIKKDILFFDLEWAKIDDRTAEDLLQSNEIERYKHYLKIIRRYKPHQLTEIEEKLLAQKEPTGISSWVRLFDTILSQKGFGKRKRTEEDVLADLYSSDREKRRKASDELTSGLSDDLHILTHIFNTILSESMIMDRLRKYPQWISSRNLSNEVDEKMVRALKNAVKSRYDIPIRYYRLKKRLLGYKKLFDYDRYAPLPFSAKKNIPWEECRESVIEAFGHFSDEIKDVASMFFDRKWIHAPVMAGKVGGAFAHPCVPNIHPYVLVNYTGNIRDIQTVAHELGHGVHQYMAGSKQGYINSSTPLPMAETASVFGEMLVFQSQLKEAPCKEEEISLLCSKLESIFATVFRQISMYEFEDEVHNKRREKGELSKEEISELWIKGNKEMFADSVHLTKNYAIWWSYIPHFIHSPGYVYAYAFGELLTLSLYKKYEEENRGFAPKYIELLSSGGKDSPKNLLRPLGINLDDPHFWSDGLTIIDEMLIRLEELTNHTQRRK
ncbi:MAG: M3 family oligoendopeptidase [Thermodesulfobacteriota bacterium]|nr:M3 family oligoendopeptidase [Thermodesulfobacteriota bacterium]